MKKMWYAARKDQYFLQATWKKQILSPHRFSNLFLQFFHDKFSANFYRHHYKITKKEGCENLCETPLAKWSLFGSSNTHWFGPDTDQQTSQPK